jgi:MscS family membrane protein
MPNFLNYSFLGNSILQYSEVLFSIIAALIFKRFISKRCAVLLYNKLVSRSNKNLRKAAFVNLIIPPLDLFVLLLVSFIALDKLQYPVELNVKVYKISLFQFVDAVCNMALILSFIWLCLRVIDFMALVLHEKAIHTADQTDNQLIIFFKDFFKAILIIIGLLLILRFSFNKDIGNLITGLSIAGAAIALATKESLENLIASFIIFFDKPFTVGDNVRVNTFSGIIEKIGLRSTRIRTDEKTYISVPNKQMVDSIVDNISLRTQRKGFLQLEISLTTTTELLQIITPSIQQILQRPEIENISVFFKETGKNAHIFEVNYYTTINQTLADFNMLREKINLDIINFLSTHNISLAGTNVGITNIKQP